MNQYPGVYGYKLGNTQLFREDGNVARVTVIEAGPDRRARQAHPREGRLLGARPRPRRAQREARVEAGRGSVQARPRRAPLFKDANTTPKQVVKELRVPAGVRGEVRGRRQTLKLEEIFEVGQFVDAQGETRGRGFTGVVRRWAFAGGVQTHGTHEYRRHGGSIGTNMTPGRTLPNLKMPGHYGAETVRSLNLKVAQDRSRRRTCSSSRAASRAAKGSLVLVRHAVKARKKHK